MPRRNSRPQHFLAVPGLGLAQPCRKEYSIAICVFRDQFRDSRVASGRSLSLDIEVAKPRGGELGVA